MITYDDFLKAYDIIEESDFNEVVSNLPKGVCIMPEFDIPCTENELVQNLVFGYLDNLEPDNIIRVIPCFNRREISFYGIKDRNLLNKIIKDFAGWEINIEEIESELTN